MPSDRKVSDKKRKRNSLEAKEAKAVKSSVPALTELEPDFEDDAAPTAGPSVTAQPEPTPAAVEDEPQETALEDSALDAYSSAVLPAAEEPTMFSSLNLTPGTAKALQEMDITTMTRIQAKTIPPLLAGRDVLGAAKTGSGKTLSFLVPVVEMLSRLRFKPRNGALFLL